MANESASTGMAELDRHITLDELPGGEVTPDYRIGRRHNLSDAPAGSVLPLLDDAEAGMRAYLRRGIDGCRNAGDSDSDSDAQCIWVLRD